MLNSLILAESNWKLSHRHNFVLDRENGLEQGVRVVTFLILKKIPVRLTWQNIPNFILLAFYILLYAQHVTPLPLKALPLSKSTEVNFRLGAAKLPTQVSYPNASRNSN